MQIRSLFNIPVTIAAPTGAQTRQYGARPTEEVEHETTTTTGGGQKSVGAFITVQSLISFTGATAVTSGLWSATRALIPGTPASNVYIGLAICLLVGLAIYLINISDQSAAPTTRDKLIGLIIAFFNTVILFNATRAIVGI